jgi:hypothetical protein
LIKSYFILADIDTLLKKLDELQALDMSIASLKAAVDLLQRFGPGTSRDKKRRAAFDIAESSTRHSLSENKLLHEEFCRSVREMHTNVKDRIKEMDERWAAVQDKIESSRTTVELKLKHACGLR